MDARKHRALPAAQTGPCACGQPSEITLAATPLCRWCWLGELDRICAARAKHADVEALRDRVMRRPPSAYDEREQAVWCSSCRRGWIGFVGEVHGVHDSDHGSCNERGVALPQAGV